METLLLLALLACPLGMGLMMWFMGKNMKGGEKSTGGAESSAGRAPRSITDLRAEQARLSSEIDRLERAGEGRDGQLARS